ncbi:MAG TPA: GMC family oxidoreductase [Allosphingosinicella sp.]|nr:GMC family oxidoreductase [Allosphingosinicella sp.]
MATNAEYDYIVIGAGASGSIVAAKAAAAGHKVLLLELGQPVDPSNPDVWDPTRWNNLLADPHFEMGYKSVAQAKLAGREMSLLQSRGLGGCQIHNAMVYVRGGRATYDHWAGPLGCTGWNYDALLPYFRDVEKTMNIITADSSDELSQSVSEALTALGYPANKDYNGGPSAYGSVDYQFAIEELADGTLRRTTSFEKFVGEASLASLTVVTGAAVLRLLLQPNMEAGVEYSDASGALTQVYARCEVVLSAGAIASPAILLRSGVGHADALKPHDIDLAAHLPEVGRNFHDDLGCGFPVFAARPFPPTPYGYLPAGLFACDSGNPPSDPAAFGEINLQFQFGTGNMAGTPAAHLLPTYALIGASAMHLESRGTISLDPADPYGHPLVDPAWLTAPGDMDRCRAALALAQSIAWEPGLMRAWKWLPLPIVSIDHWIRGTGTTVQHYVGSCQMGPKPETSVVGPDLRVHGLSNVRVIDASVAPTPVTGNTAGVSMVIGAKGAELLLNG